MYPDESQRLDIVFFEEDVTEIFSVSVCLTDDIAKCVSVLRTIDLKQKLFQRINDDDDIYYVSEGGFFNIYLPDNLIIIYLKLTKQICRPNIISKNKAPLRKHNAR